MILQLVKLRTESELSATIAELYRVRETPVVEVVETLFRLRESTS